MAGIIIVVEKILPNYECIVTQDHQFDRIAPIHRSKIVNSPNGLEVAKDRLILILADPTTREELVKIIEQQNGVIIGSLKTTSIYQVKFPCLNSIEDLTLKKDELLNLDEIESVAYDFVENIVPTVIN